MKITASTKIILWPTPLKTGLHDIRLRVTHNRKSRYYSLNISCNPDNWNNATSRIVPIKSHKYENELITSVEARALHILRNIALNNHTFSFDDFATECFSNYEIRNNTANIVEILQTEVNFFTSQNKFSSVKTRKAVISLLNTLKITTTDLTDQHLKSIVNHLNNNHAAPKTIKAYLSILKKAYNTAKAKGLVYRKTNPFDNLKLKLDLSTSKRALPLTAIQHIETVALSSLHHALCRDLFVFSFYARGMNMKDILTLTPANIQGDRIVYTRSKTKKKYSINIAPQLQAIINRHICKKGKYIFPVLNTSKPLTSEQIYDKINRATYQANLFLKNNHELLQIPEGTTFYAARHTYATALLRAGVGHEVIKEAMGHSSIATTEIYLAELGNSAVDAADSLIF